jgi:ssDNA-binding Zn-finger/Zn-ribbon topoisomerase 1
MFSELILELKEKEKKLSMRDDTVYCDICGAEMIKRKSKWGGYWWGCSNYPKCRNTKK